MSSSNSSPGAQASALKAQGRFEEALALYRQAALAKPSSGVAQHNIASTLGDLGRHAEAEAAADRAFRLGLEAPETWLVKARACMGLGRLEDADSAFRQALRRRPDYVEAHRDLAQLLWMRSGDPAVAVSTLESAPRTAALLALRARVQEYAGDLVAAAASLEQALQAAPSDPGLHVFASALAVQAGRPETALRYAETAARLAPADRAAAVALCTAQLGAGRAEAATRLASALLARASGDQGLIALQATAWRLTGDPRWRDLWDPELIQARTLDAPEGWPGLQAWLLELASALEGLHGELITHPLEQSLRGGSQTPQNLQAVEHPAVRAFFRAIDPAVRAYLAAIGQGAGPLRSRNTGDYRMKGVWSVRLRPGGRHVDHVHSEGWISSAFYVDLPGAVGGPGREGWIRFGRPPFPTQPEIEPFLHVRPEPGRLVLFPSYLWHGTEPFSGDDQRLTVAFDLLPA